MEKFTRPLSLLLAVLLILTSLGVPVEAQGNIVDRNTLINQDEVFLGSGVNAVVPGGPGFIMVHPAAFNPMNSTGEYALSAGGGGLYNPGDSFTIYYAAVNLPHGAKITKMVVYYVDNSPASGIWAVLSTVSMDTQDSSQMASLFSQDADPNIRVLEATNIAQDVINNQSNAYWIDVGIAGSQSTNLRIRGIRIDYSYQVELPVVTK